MTDLLSLEAARGQLLACAPRMEQESVAIEVALGRVLAEDVSARRTQPSADLSAMDGYALGPGNGPWRLMGESRAGAPFAGTLSAGECTRISTGAHMPQGADRVLIQENALVSDDTVAATTLPIADQHVRKAGFDFAEGKTVLKKGALIGPGQIALAMAAGHGKLPVSNRPRIAILDSGDELAANPEQCGPDQIPASNGAMIAAMLAPVVGETMRIGPVADDLEALADALTKAEDCDILITSGGASVGDHDLVQDALRAWGAEITFWKVAIKPGKPLMVAQRKTERGNQIILGLPGNPVSSFVTCFLFALPLVRRAMGMGKLESVPQYRIARADRALPATGARREFLRGWFGGYRVIPFASKDSSALWELNEANCLIVRYENSGPLDEGAEVTVLPFLNG